MSDKKTSNALQHYRKSVAEIGQSFSPIDKNPKNLYDVINMGWDAGKSFSKLSVKTILIPHARRPNELSIVSLEIITKSLSWEGQ